ncbi:ATP-binding protein [Pseudemcibacter aquimaris]|uniref:ATP-binding protein n=1 Tax=Pseudemcibacter aquimaris TaxID=2857064 RepID=UPI0020131F71|nr:ATP-binding protein [Pseudemcibacter aquimaris]MCC3860049.1 ATP-binding protein [Pseudemcibacter aquimaris]WDU57379.1 ATP-binding protein [Pseudemcibacter aquimaris]
MSDVEQEEKKPLKAVGVVTETLGNGLRAICNLETLREMSSVDYNDVDLSPGQIGTILKIKVAKGYLFVTVRGIKSLLENNLPTNQVSMQLDYLGHGMLAPMTRSGMTFDRGVKDFPVPGEKIYPVTTKDVEAIFGFNDRNHFHLGQVFPQHITPASFDINALLGKHFAVLGSTGTGKSCTVALIIRRIVERLPKAHIIMLDPHNEYETAFSDCAEHFDIKNLRLPYWMMNFEEHIEMFIGTYKANTRMTEIDVLRRALYAARVDNSDFLSPDEITVDTPIPYKLSFLIKFLDEEMGKLENPDNITPFLRIKNKVEELRKDTRFSFMFSGMLANDNLGMTLSNLFRFPVDDKPISTIDLSGVPSEIVNVVVSVISRAVFDFAVWSRGDDASPILLVCEEAHRYVPTDLSTVFASTKKAIERIAKEGRKYGVSLGLVSQRPADVSESALSQCGTIFSMRLNNERDQNFVAHVMPEGSSGSLASLSSLQNREVLAVGEGVVAPVRMLVDKLEENHLPSSGSPDFATDWQHTLEDPDFVNKTIYNWRKFGRGER